MGDAIPSPHPGPWVQTDLVRRPRVWPGVVIVLLYWACLKLPGYFVPGTMYQMYIGMMSPMLWIGLFLIWWLFFSRVKWAERFVGLIACGLIGTVAVRYLYDPTMRGDKPEDAMMGLMLNILPVVMTGWVLWLLAGRPARTAGLVAVFLLTWGAFATLRFDGVTGAFDSEYSLRWKQTSEQKMLASRAAGQPAAGSVADASGSPVELGAADWPGFRGPARDGVRTGVRVGTDWKAHPPKELWRHPVGPGWSSFAVVGSRLFTQEQLGDAERVVCYDADTGKEVWSHTDEVRFTEPVSGAGPRATPTFHAGKVYALGAKGRLNCLDAATGKPVWSQDIVADSNAKVPMWAFSSSPLVFDGLVTVWAGGPDNKSVLAYHADTGKLAWTSGKGTGSYSSVQHVRIGGTDQLVLIALEGMTGFNPADGKILWEYDWKAGDDFNRVTQPAVLGDGDLLIGTGFDMGSHRVKVAKGKDGWTAEKTAEITTISPYFNDLVVHKGHLYGFNSVFLTCVNVDSGKRTWKERGYGSGQVLLLADQDLLLVLSEKGEVALVEATPTARKEVAKFQAINGKTWNHPVVAGRKLYVRNGEEMACFELPADDKAVVAK